MKLYVQVYLYVLWIYSCSWCFFNLFLFQHQKTLYFLGSPYWACGKYHQHPSSWGWLIHFSVLFYFSFFQHHWPFFFSCVDSTVTPEMSKIIWTDIPLFSFVTFSSVWYVYSNSFKRCCISAPSWQEKTSCLHPAHFTFVSTGRLCSSFPSVPVTLWQWFQQPGCEATYLLYLYSPQRALFFSSVHTAQAEEQSYFAGHDKRYCSFHRWPLGTPPVPAVQSPRTSLEAPAEVQHPFFPAVALRGHWYDFSTRDGTLHKALQELAILDVTERDLSRKVQVGMQSHGLELERSE